jgi:8-oxo-dGTP pyrophosphatase MutT (NUDIX family)
MDQYSFPEKFCTTSSSAKMGQNFSGDLYIQKVCPVILRPWEDGWQILAFRHPKAGTQLIKGTLESGERPEVAVLRELAEESGIDQATVMAKIGEIDVLETEQHWHIYHCQPASDLPEEWSFFTTDGGGLLFHFFWHRLAEEADETWHPHFRRALEFIRSWQQSIGIQMMF